MGSKQQTALITGASGGIGYALARLFARDGYDLVLVARSVDKLNDIALSLHTRHGVQVTVIGKDLAVPTAPQEICDELQAHGITVDILVNNAGFATYGVFAETNLQAELEMMQVNIVALTHLTKLFLPPMLARRRGKIMNVASTAAFQPGPLMAVYYASKAYVLSFSEALANELESTGVTITAFCPGATRTGFQERAAMEASKLVQGVILDAATVARIGYRGLMRRQTIVIPGRRSQFLSFAVRLLPRSWATRIVRRAQEANSGL